MTSVLTQSSQANASARHEQPTTICVVDDSPTIRAIVRVTLEPPGYTVHAFADGNALWRWLGEQTVLPALLLLDIELPTMDGYDLARYVRQHPRYQAIPLIMLSSRDSVTDRLKARVAGVQAYLTKPFAVQQLLAIVQRVLEPGNLGPGTASETSRETH